jgi:uncharacterized protein YaiL (DUF2058 family)
MAGSLQDQLLKAGLTDDKKLKQLSKDKRKQKKRKRHDPGAAVDEVKLAAQQALEEKARRSRELAREQNLEAEKRAIAAQIRQLIVVNRVSRDGCDIPYNFSDGKLIKKLYVNAAMQLHLSRGQLAIVRLDDGYELVPEQVAGKISERDASCIVLRNDPGQQKAEEDENDPYADYKIPDDLMW